MEKPFGFRGIITPPIKNLNEDIPYNDGISVSIRDGVFEVGYDKEGDEEKAHRVADNFIAAWAFRTGFKISVNFDQTWKPSSTGGKHVSISLSEKIRVSDRITTSVIRKELTYVVKQKSDSYSFLNDVTLVKRATEDETLSLALNYFYSDAYDEKHAMGGMHKAIEQITKHLGDGDDKKGRTILAGLVGRDVSYINELMTSVQKQRHSKIWWVRQNQKPSIDQGECLNRTRQLIDAYASSLH